MLKYILVRISWIFIILFTILSLNFVLLKLAPSYPPAEKDQRDIYYARQVLDGYMTDEVIDDPAIVNAYKEGTYAKDPKKYYSLEGANESSLRIYTDVSIAKQYITWLGKIVTKWDWGLSTRIQVNEPAFDILKGGLLELEMGSEPNYNWGVEQF